MIPVNLEPLVWREDDAADRLCISPRTLRELARAGVLPRYKIAGCTVYRESDIREYVATLEPIDSST